MTVAISETSTAPEVQEGAPMEAPKKPRLSAMAAVRAVLCGIVWAVVTALVAVVITVGVAPLTLNAVKKTILTGSMAGSYNPGDMVVIQPQPVKSYRIGDPVTYQPISGDNSTYVTHRIIAVSLGNAPGAIDGVAGFTTQGDANNVADKPIEAGQVMGKVIYHVPYAGYASQWIAQALAGVQFSLLGTILGVGLIGWSILSAIPWSRMFAAFGGTRSERGTLR